MSGLAEFGIIGLGVMGKSLALNLASKNVSVAIYNRHVAGREEGIAKSIADAYPAYSVHPFDDLHAFVASLRTPRTILMMVYAGAVDAQLESLLPLLSPGDIVIDGGNSYYADTDKRIAKLQQHGLTFIGSGISGGEAGALHGPALMPSGPVEGYAVISKYFDLLAARDRNGKPCSAYIGPGGSGHFVKMVHNGIEYAEMQLIAEVYSLLRYHLHYSAEQIIEVFDEWTASGSGSFLLDVTINILNKKENGELLLDKILDKAEQKGTGSWSATAAIQLGAPYSSLTEAVMARYISAQKEKRLQLSSQYERVKNVSRRNITPDQVKNSYDSCRIINHEIGFELIKHASQQNEWNLNCSEIARIWTNGCIIKSELMESISESFKDHESLLTTATFSNQLNTSLEDYSGIVSAGLQDGIALPVLSSALNYLLGITTANSSANLIQAMRDYFGAHTYQRTDRPHDKYFHTDWNA